MGIRLQGINSSLSFYWYLTNMSVGDKIVFICVIYLSYKVVLTGCEVVLVNRNVTDSFRVGKGGCKNDSNVCPSSSTCQRDSGLCLCGRLPNFRNPVVENINGYKCVSSQEIIAGLNGELLLISILGTLSCLTHKL